jgi:hypothetical protein
MARDILDAVRGGVAERCPGYETVLSASVAKEPMSNGYKVGRWES